MPKPIEELTIVDDFMFGAVMSNPRYCKPLLELILGVRIREIRYPEAQKSMSERYASKGIRLDVYVEDDAGTVYDVEIQTADKQGLPKRMRYYQGIIDLHILEKGADYTALRRSFVIFICTYDPFGKGRYAYTFESRCLEDSALALGDGATKIVLNTKGHVGEVSAELKELLRYMNGHAPGNDYTRELDDMVSAIRGDEKWRLEYMLLNEMLWRSERLGERKSRVTMVRRSRNRFNVDELSRIYYIDLKAVQAILDIMDAHPDWDDKKIAENVDFD